MIKITPNRQTDNGSSLTSSVTNLIFVKMNRNKLTYISEHEFNFNDKNQKHFTRVVLKMKCNSFEKQQASSVF